MAWAALRRLEVAFELGYFRSIGEVSTGMDQQAMVNPRDCANIWVKFSGSDQKIIFFYIYIFIFYFSFSQNH
jgi:hypothetical protein